MFKRQIPLAWLQLSRVPSRLLVAVAGIAFADFLMFLNLTRSASHFRVRPFAERYKYLTQAQS